MLRKCLSYVQNSQARRYLHVSRSLSEKCNDVTVRLYVQKKSSKSSSNSNASKEVSKCSGPAKERAMWTDNPDYWMHNPKLAYMQPSYRLELSKSLNLASGKGVEFVPVDFGKKARCEVEMRERNRDARVLQRKRLGYDPDLPRCNAECPKPIPQKEKPCAPAYRSLRSLLDDSPLMGYAKSTDPVIDKSEWLQPQKLIAKSFDMKVVDLPVDFDKANRCMAEKICEMANKSKVTLKFAPPCPEEREEQRALETQCNRGPAKVYCCEDPTAKPGCPKRN